MTPQLEVLKHLGHQNFDDNRSAELKQFFHLGHSYIIHWFSSPAHLLCTHLLPKHPTSLFMSAELIPRPLKVWGKTAHAMFAAYNISGSLLSIKGQYGLHVFDIQRVEQDNGVLECIHIVQGNAFYPGKFTVFTQMQ